MNAAQLFGSLDGLRVVDLSQNLAGPWATRILADLGADVIKVEPPGGDPARSWGPPFHGEEGEEGDGMLFWVANRNKRSVVLDLKTPSGREHLDTLVDGADVFVQAFRPGVAQRLGVGAARLRARHPSLVYASVNAFGTTGPLQQRPGFDPLVQAFAGIMSVTGPPGGPPARVGTSLVDLGTGMWLALAILAALRVRDRTGEGGEVESSLFDTALGWMGYHLVGVDAGGAVPEPAGTAFPAIAPYEALPTADGLLMVACGNDALFQRLARALDRPDLGSDPRFATNPLRVRNREALLEELASATRSSTRSELEDRLVAARIPAAPIQGVDAVLDHPQTRARGMLQPSPRADAPEARDVALPITVGEPPAAEGDPPPRAPVRRPPPRLGQHTREVLEEGWDGGSP